MLPNAMRISRYKEIDDTRVSPQTREQAQRYNKTIATGLRGYVSDHQHGGDSFIQPLTYA